MATKWTDDQRKAIEYSDCNLLVSAAAGSGKTAVLIQRIIERITREKNSIDVDRLLVMTFTNAAASEMRERLARALLDKLDEAPENTALQRQYMLLGKANIMTIHSFCLNLIKENFHMLSVDPDFSVGDVNEIKLLLNDSFEEAFQELIVAEDVGFIALLKAYGGKNGKSVIELGKKVFATIQSNPWPQEWLEESVGKFEDALRVPVEETFYGSEIINNAKEKLDYYIFRIEEICELLYGDLFLSGYVDTFLSEKQMLEDYRSTLESDWDSINDKFCGIVFGRMNSAKKGADEDLKAKAKSIRDEYKGVIKDLSNLDFALNAEECRADFEALLSHFLAFSRYIRISSEKFATAKSATKVLDFSDFEHFALELLVDNETKEPTDLAVSLREKFEEVLIDEYQDTNEIQETILRSVSREGEKRNLFMVGDVKQSIYRFRHAKPELFREKSKVFHNDGFSQERKVILGKNFRSRGELLEKINWVFESIMTEALGEVDYGEDERLNIGANYPELSIIDQELEINIIDMEELDDSESEDEDVKKNVVAEARFVISKISELMSEESDFQLTDKENKEFRKPRFSDFIILMRSAKEWAVEFEAQFNIAGIPVFSDTSTSLFETIEVMSVMSLLKALNNPLDDISLISLLRSNLFSFTNNELADIRIALRDARYFDAVKASKDSKSVEFLETFTAWRELSGIIRISELVWRILNDTGYLTFIGGLPDGHKRQNNLKLLFEYIRNFERAGMVGLFNLIDYLENVFGSSSDMGEARLIGEEDNVVRIMSIHKSKGLEFPIVFLAGTGRSFNKMDERSSVLVHQKHGFGPDIINYERNIKYPSIAKRALCSIIERDNISEEMRILYVAMTRAKEKLIIVASLNKAQDKLNNFISDASFLNINKLHPLFLMKSPSYIKWVYCALAKHGIQNPIFWHHSVFAVDAEGLPGEPAGLPGVEGAEREPGAKKSAAQRIETWLEEKDTAVFEEIRGALEWATSGREELSVPAKISVTELKKLEESGRNEESALPLMKQANTDFNKPAFLKVASELSGAEIGTAYHKVFFLLDFSSGLSLEEVRSQIAKMLANQLISEAEFANIDALRVQEFANSDMCEQIRNSKCYFKEKSFLYRSDEVGEDTIVQGVIDLYFVNKSNEIVVIDYKSDRTNDIEELRNRYFAQINYYSGALEQITGMRVAARFLYLVNLGEFVEI